MTPYLDLQPGRSVVAPFTFDGLQAVLAAQAGFEALYMTGFGTAASFGLPDLGLLTMTEMVERAQVLAGAARVPVIADADTGYGNPINVMRCVRSYESAGVAAIHIEDQVFPKRCGFLQNKEVIAPEQMAAKVRAAVDSRDDARFRIIARTDALQPNGWDDVCRRAELYLGAGADLLFVDGIRSREDLDVYCQRLGQFPLVYNGMLEPVADLCARGFALVLHPGTLMRHIEDFRSSLQALAGTGEISVSGSSFRDAIAALGVADVLALSERYEA
ncbi:MAG: isocitrate lyase/PEP mutase family protein [Pseudomonadales bacterium]